MPARLAQHLVTKGLLPARTVEEAQRKRATSGGTLDTVLLEMGVIAEPGMLQALADVSGMRPVNLADFEPNTDMARYVPANVADRLGAVPLSVDGNSLHIACCYPPPQKDLEEVSVLLGKRLEAWIAIEARVRDWISSVYGVPLPYRFGLLLSQLDPNRAPPPAPASVAQAQTRVAQQAPLAPLPIPLAKPSSGARVIPVQEATLEDALTREMVEQIARAVAEEPILLEVRKKPAPQPVRDEPTQEMDVRDAAKLGADEEEATKTYDLSKLAVHTLPTPPPSPPTWDRDSTVTFNLEPLAKASVPAELPKAERPPNRPTQPEFPAVVVFPNPSAQVTPPIGREPVKPPTAPPPPAPSEEVPDWSLSQAREALREASQDRDRIIDVALRFARRTFESAFAFAIVRGTAVGWSALGENSASFREAPPSIPLDAPSVFRTVAMTRGSYVGPVPQDANTAAYLQQMGRSPRTLFLYPVEVKDRLVCLLYGDPGARPISQRRLSELLLFCQDLPGAFQELIVFKKQRFGATPKSALSLEEVVQRPAAASGLGWSPMATERGSGVGRSAAMSPLLDDPTRPPPDFTPILRRLTGPDAAARASAMAELARTPSASARVLADAFPGPTAWSRLPVGELPEPDELGPLPAALSRLGRPGAQALAPLLDADDPDVRYFALLTAGSLPFPELVGGVLRGLFDFEPDISSAARAAAATLRKLPRFQDALPDLRRELAAVDALRRSLAARALGVLHDREAIEGLINLTGSDDELSAQAASEALREITRAHFGPDQRRWTAWWAEMRGRTRGQWLVAALRHPDVDLRLAAIEELSKTLNDNLGYFADAPEPERDAAIARWEAALKDNPRLKRVE